MPPENFSKFTPAPKHRGRESAAREFTKPAKFAIVILTLAFFVFLKPASANANIVINEVMYDLKGADDKHEWVELLNTGFIPVDLTGWKFNDGDDATNHGLNPPPKNGSRGSMIIPAGGFTLLTGNAETLVANLLNYSGTIIDTAMTLNNTSAQLKILNKDGVAMASASYSKTMGGKGNGKTLEWDGAAFKESLTNNGTPGAPNSVLAGQTAFSPSPSPIPTTSASPTPSSLPSTSTAPGRNEKNQTAGNNAELNNETESDNKNSDLAAEIKINQENRAVAGENIAGKSPLKTILTLLGIIALSALSALGLLQFRRRQIKLTEKK